MSNIEDAYKTLYEYRESPAAKALQIILHDEREKRRDALENAEDPVIRGQAQMCKKLLNKMSTEIVDSEE